MGHVRGRVARNCRGSTMAVQLRLHTCGHMPVTYTRLSTFFVGVCVLVRARHPARQCCTRNTKVCLRLDTPRDTGIPRNQSIGRYPFQSIRTDQSFRKFPWDRYTREWYTRIPRVWLFLRWRGDWSLSWVDNWHNCHAIAEQPWIPRDWLKITGIFKGFYFEGFARFWWCNIVVRCRVHREWGSKRGRSFEYALT